MQTVECPYCGLDFPENCEYTDIGVGYQQTTGNVCDRCGAVELGGNARDTDQPWEKETGWREPCGYGQHEAWITTLVANAFALGVQHMARLVERPASCSPLDSLAPTLKVTVALPSLQVLDAHF